VDERASDLQHGQGSKLWQYWTKGKGLARWSGAVHKWTTLRDLLLKEGVPPAEADGLATNIINAVMPGYMKQAHQKKGRSAVTVLDTARSGPDADGLDASWDNLDGIPDLTGLTVADFEAVDGGEAAASGTLRAAALGSGGRFKALKAKLAAKGASNPGALAAYIGRKKFGKAKFAALAGKARKHKGGRSTRPVPDLDVIRTGGGLALDDEHGTLGTLHGRFAEFGRWYKVRSRFEGDFMERVQPGATLDTIRDDRDGMRVLFDHGMDPSLGNKVLGPIQTLDEAQDGPRYEVPLFDTSYNRDLLPGLKAGVYGASMRMRVLGDTWDDEPRRSDYNPDGLKERTITRMRVAEFGPVTFPANPGATAGMRSATDDFYGRMAEHNPAVFAEAVRAAGLSLEDFTGRDGARSVPGGDLDGRPGNGRPSPRQPSRSALERDRAWRMRGVR